MIKGTIQPEDMTLVNIYASNIKTPKYVKQILMDIMGESDSNTVIVGDLNSPLTSMNRSSRQKINEKAVALKNPLDQINVIDIFRAFHPKTPDYIFFSSAHGSFSRINHMLGYKTSLNKFKKIKIISNIF